MVRSPVDETDFSDIIAGVLHGDTLAPYFFIISPNYVQWTLIDLIKIVQHLKKTWSRWYPPETMIDTNYADYPALFTNTSARVKSLQHRQEHVAEGIGLYVNNTPPRNLCALNRKESLIYIGSNISSIENDVNVRVKKARIAIKKQLIIYKSDPSDKIKRYFFQAVCLSILLYGFNTLNLKKCNI